MIEKEFDLTNLTNEELNLLVENLQSEKKRREKMGKRQAALELREALGRFLDSGASEDFSLDIELMGCDVEVYFDDYKNYDETDVNYVVFDVFERDVLLHIKNELTRCVGNYEG